MKFANVGLAVSHVKFSSAGIAVPEQRVRQYYISVMPKLMVDMAERRGWDALPARDSAQALRWSMGLVDKVTDFARSKLGLLSDLPLYEFLLPEGHPSIERVSQSLWCFEMKEPDMTCEWIELHRGIFADHGLTFHSSPTDPAYTGNRWYHQMPARERSILEFYDKLDPVDHDDIADPLDEDAVEL